MFKRLRKWVDERRYPHMDDPKGLRSYVLNIMSSQRILREYNNKLPSPFLELLEWSSNLLSVFSNLRDFNRHTKRVIPQRMVSNLTRGCRDMKMVGRNFDHVLAKRFEQKLVEQNGKPIWKRQTIMQIIEECFNEIDFSDAEYQEWAKDSFERVTRFRNNLQVVSARQIEKFPVIDDMLYYAFAGYRMDKVKILHSHVGGFDGVRSLS